MPPVLTLREIDRDKFAYTMDEAKHALGVGRNKFYGLIRAGEIKPFPFCGRPHLHRDDLKAAADRAFFNTHHHLPGERPAPGPGQAGVRPVQSPSAQRRRSTPG